ncbi:hypothetical protein BHE74_00006770 [Ensete ventricosum]|nr:hypothetical protein GW17_00004617 [Ensete ventricosum]RWW84613.1 hypothetical protein BHE74_00006770 [Ensete ventricosum]
MAYDLLPHGSSQDGNLTAATRTTGVCRFPVARRFTWPGCSSLGVGAFSENGPFRPSGQMGNPVLEFATDFNSRAEFFWSHGLISDSTYRIFTSACNYSRYVSEYYRGSLSPVCARVMSQVTRETSRFVDKYDVTLDVCISSVLSQSLVLSPQVGLHLFADPWPTFTLIPVSELDFVGAAASPGEYRCDSSLQGLVRGETGERRIHEAVYRSDMVRFREAHIGS